jgi:aspartyl-tRNA(Asn)/glutamyl-tRNA(Gln) amidotransferase subunit B
LLARSLNQHEIDISESPVPATKLAEILRRISDGTLSNKTAQRLFERAWASGPDASIDELIEREGLKQVSDAGAIDKLLDEVLAANPKQVEDYRAGKEKAFNSLVGQVMKASKGKANPAQVNELLRRKLSR